MPHLMKLRPAFLFSSIKDVFITTKFSSFHCQGWIYYENY